MLTEFHLLRPWWLLALPFVIWLIWGWWRGFSTETPWRGICDAWLLPHLLSGQNQSRRALPLALLSLGLLLTILALAGPSWDKVERPLHRSLQARVIVMDLSLSMNAQDYSPSRLQLAQSKVTEILRRSEEHEVGLVVFAGAAFIVAPLTYDSNTLNAFVEALHPNIIPVPGSRPDRGMERALELLQQAGATSGELLLICDGFRGDRAIELAGDLRFSGYRTSVLAAGSGQSVPIPQPSGDSLRGVDGNIALAYTDLDQLKAIADAGGGRFVQMNESADHSDIDQLLSSNISQTLNAEMHTLDATAASWSDQGIWLLLLVLPLAAAAFRRGWLVTALLIGITPLPDKAAYADDWQHWWARPDQQAARALAAGRPAELFESSDDPAWRGSALYRRGDYLSAAEAFAELDDADGHYNRGNALAKANQLEAAIEAYTIALEYSPSHLDAIYNRRLLQSLLEQQQQQNSSQSDSPSDSRQNNTNPPQQADQQTQNNDPGSLPQQLSESIRTETSGSSEVGSAKAASTANNNDSSMDYIGSNVAARASDETSETAEQVFEQSLQEWLEQVEEDPGELLRRKFERDYRRSRFRNVELNDAW